MKWCRILVLVTPWQAGPSMKQLFALHQEDCGHLKQVFHNNLSVQLCITQCRAAARMRNTPEEARGAGLTELECTDNRVNGCVQWQVH